VLKYTIAGVIWADSVIVLRTARFEAKMMKIGRSDIPTEFIDRSAIFSTYKRDGIFLLRISR
jgi:hypothetical protein